jgi:hypothetical protein
MLELLEQKDNICVALLLLASKIRKIDETVNQRKVRQLYESIAHVRTHREMPHFYWW